MLRKRPCVIFHCIAAVSRLLAMATVSDEKPRKRRAPSASAQPRKKPAPSERVLLRAVEVADPQEVPLFIDKGDLKDAPVAVPLGRGRDLGKVAEQNGRRYLIVGVVDYGSHVHSTVDSCAHIPRVLKPMLKEVLGLYKVPIETVEAEVEKFAAVCAGDANSSVAMDALPCCDLDSLRKNKDHFSGFADWLAAVKQGLGSIVGDVPHQSWRSILDKALRGCCQSMTPLEVQQDRWLLDLLCISALFVGFAVVVLERRLSQELRDCGDEVARRVAEHVTQWEAREECCLTIARILESQVAVAKTPRSARRHIDLALKEIKQVVSSVQTPEVIEERDPPLEEESS